MSPLDRRVFVKRMGDGVGRSGSVVSGSRSRFRGLARRLRRGPSRCGVEKDTLPLLRRGLRPTGRTRRRAGGCGEGRPRLFRESRAVLRKGVITRCRPYTDRIA